MRAKGEGSLDQRENGNWRLRFTLPNGKRATRTFATEAEANAVRNAAIHEIASDMLVGNVEEAVSLTSYAPGWLDRREIDGVRGIKNERSLWKAHIFTAPFAHTELSEISRDDVKAWLLQLQRTRGRARSSWGSDMRYTNKLLSCQTRTHILNALRLCLASALEDGLVQQNVALGLRVETRRDRVRTEETWTILTVQEMELIRNSPHVTQQEKDMLEVAWYTGLRPGELFGLTWRDVDLSKPQITVRYSWNGPTKSGKPRVVPLMLPAIAALERHMATSKHTKADDRVFCTVTGLPRSRNNTGGWADRAQYIGEPKREGIKTRAGITRPITFYSATRHTCASHLLMGTYGLQWSISEIGAMLGHSDTEVTQRYAKVLGTHLHMKVGEASKAIQDQKRSGPEGAKSTPKSKLSNQRIPRKSTNETEVERVTGIEPATTSLGSNPTPEQRRGLTLPWDQCRTTSISDLAFECVQGVAKGLPILAQATALVAIVSAIPGHPGRSLALAVDWSSDHWPLRVLTLAGAVLANDQLKVSG